MTPLRAVFDCQVFLQAALNDRGPAARCLQLAEAGLVELCISDAVLDEVTDVLNRPELRRRFTQLTPELVDSLLQRVRQFTFVVAEVTPVFHYERDPDDEPYLNLAIAAGATHLVSRDLLDLRAGTSPDGQRLRALAPQLVIIDPVEFLHTFDSANHSE